MIWRHHYQSEKNGESTAGSRRKRPDYLHIHNFFFLSFNDFKKWKRSVSPSQRIKTNCTAGGGQKPFSTGKILPKFSVIHKTYEVRPHNHWGVRVCFPCQCVNATEPIHSNTLSKHTQASRLPQTQPARGHGVEAGLHTRHLLSLPRRHPPSNYIGEGE